MFMVELILVAPNWKQSRYPSAKWINYFVHKMEYGTHTIKKMNYRYMQQYG